MGLLVSKLTLAGLPVCLGLSEAFSEKVVLVLQEARQKTSDGSNVETRSLALASQKCKG